MDAYSSQITKLIEELGKLPGIGAKSAQRLAFHIINMPEDRVESLADTIVTARKKTHYCKKCFNLTDADLCPICADSAGITVQSWLWSHRAIWQLTKRHRSIPVFTMYFTARFRPCWASALLTFV